ncbi:MAG: metal ABC transporter solute-binding protein, Zn/Mn family [Lentimicrobium sp.]
MLRTFLLILILLTAGLWACQSRRPAETNTKTATVTILPQKYILERIAGDKFSINVLIPEEANHETYEPTARQMIETGKSTAYFKVGHLDVEKSWLGKLAESNPGMKIYDTSEGYRLMSGETHSHGDHVHEGATDPHTWLSVSGVRVQAVNMLKGLTETDPENAEFYKHNYELFAVSLDSLDRDIRRILTSAGTNSFMIYHPSLGYFARDYNLQQIAIEQEGKEPSPAYMKELIDLAKNKNIRTIFISSQFNKQSAVTIAGQINAKVEEFNPSSPDWSNNLKSIARKIAGASTEQ